MFAVAFAVLAAGAIVLTLNVLLLVHPSSAHLSLLLMYHNASAYKIVGYLTCNVIYLVMTVNFCYRVGISSSSKASAFLDTACSLLMSGL